MNISADSGLLKVASCAAVRAGACARELFGGVREEFKLGGHIVTSADRRCQSLIIESITSERPSDGFLAEESTEQGSRLFKQPPTGDEDIWWIIDPIDGTRNFAHAVPFYAVSIGVIKNGIPIVGAIYDPVNDMLLTAERGGPAMCNGRQIHCRNENLHRNSQIVISGHSECNTPEMIVSIIESHVCINLGSAALHLAYLAMGAYSASIAWNVSIWDIAAGLVICQSAGAIATDLQGKKQIPFDCNNYDGRTCPTLVAGDIAHEKLVKTLAGQT